MAPEAAGVARRTKQLTVPLELPRPFQGSLASFTTTRELVDVLALIDELHDKTHPEDGGFPTSALLELLALVEPSATNLFDDFAMGVAVGFAVHRVTRDRPALATPDDQVAPMVMHALAWAAMEQGADAPERHGPWIGYATQLGYVLARRGAGALRAAMAELSSWHLSSPPMTHSAYFDQRLVLDIGTADDGAVVARSYLPLRPAGIEHAHDVLLFQTACDDFTERTLGRRVNGTTPMRNVFRFHWKVLQ
jgi:hypothetical protein